MASRPPATLFVLFAAAAGTGLIGLRLRGCVDNGAGVIEGVELPGGEFCCRPGLPARAAHILLSRLFGETIPAVKFGNPRIHPLLVICFALDGRMDVNARLRSQE